jgi:hypothetical protein
LGGACNNKTKPQFRTLGDILYGQQGKTSVLAPSQMIGWMELDTGSGSPMIQVTSGKMRIGAGAMVTRSVAVPVIGNLQITAVAQAYVVDGSGSTGEQVADPSGVMRMVFKPTYWVKLAGPAS